MPTEPIEVVAGVLRDPAGRVLLNRRPSGRPQGGFWEFPGGKIEPGEAPAEALARELREELGVRIGPLRPLAAIRSDAHDPAVRLWLHEALHFEGMPEALEGQVLEWVSADALLGQDLLPIDRALARVLELDGYYAMTPPLVQLGGERALLRAWNQCLDTGFRLLGLRLAEGETLSAETVDALADACAQADARWLVSGTGEECRGWPADGLHLDTRSLVTLRRRPGAEGALLAATCHDLEEIRMADALDVDLVVLSAVVDARKPAQAPVLGWDDFRRILRHAPRPVLAAGGLRPDDWARVRAAGAFGVAGCRAFGWT